MNLTRKLSCPSCGAGLKLADNLPAGKRIACPKCKKPFAVPELPEPEDEEVSPVEVTPQRARKSAPPPEPEDSDEEVRERPAVRKRRRKPKKEPSKAPLVIGIVAGLVLLIGVGVTLAVVLGSKKKKTETAGTSQPPSGQPGPGGAPGEGMRGGMPGGGMMGGGMMGEGQRGGMPGGGMMGEGMRGGMPGGGMRGGMPGGGMMGGGMRGGMPGPGGFGPGGSGPGGGESGGGTGSTDVPKEFAAGRKVFEAHNCTRCHATGGGRRGRGPDLSRVGANHNADWISEHIRDPQSHNPRSNMPKYEGKISAEDLKALSEYLASLK